MEWQREWLLMNYSAPVELHDYRYLGNTFRDRERIKRKVRKMGGKTSIHAYVRTPGVTICPTGDQGAIEVF